MDIKEKICPICRESAEGLVSINGGVFISPCFHPVIRIKSPIGETLRKLYVLRKLETMKTPIPDIKSIRKARLAVSKGRGGIIKEILIGNEK